MYLPPLTQGRSLGLATPLITATSVPFSWQEVDLFSRRPYLWPHQTGDVSDACSTSLQQQTWVKRAWTTVLCSQHVVFHCTHRDAGAHCSLYIFISNHERNYEFIWIYTCKYFQAIYCMCVYLYIHKYTQHAHILCKQCFLFWMRLIAVNRLTALKISQQYLKRRYT